MSLQELRKRGCYMDESQWLTRILFLETTAAIPGMVAGGSSSSSSPRSRRAASFVSSR
ncbi:hypothetical protein BDY24DRAFT_389337 [Mrakia frigida]|uniref:uncharacterized protein n=1 Tax=Mrakia frigida TaxID=29902 RepID=UPI003FCC197B